MGATTVEELEIIVSTKIEQVRPQIQKVVQEIKNAVKETDGLGTNILGKIDTQKIKRDASNVKEQIDKVFGTDNTSAQEKYLQNKIEKLKTSIKEYEKFNSSLKHPELAELYGTEPDKILKMKAELEKLENKLNKIQKLKILDPGDTSGIRFHGIEKTISGVSNQIRNLKGQTIDLDRIIDFQRLQQNARKAREQLRQLEREASGKGFEKVNTSGYYDLINGKRSIKDTIKPKVETEGAKRELTSLKVYMDKLKKYKLNIGNTQFDFSKVLVDMRKAKRYASEITQNLKKTSINRNKVNTILYR